MGSKNEETGIGRAEAYGNMTKLESGHQWNMGVGVVSRESVWSDGCVHSGADLLGQVEQQRGECPAEPL